MLFKVRKKNEELKHLEISLDFQNSIRIYKMRKEILLLQIYWSLNQIFKKYLIKALNGEQFFDTIEA